MKSAEYYIKELQLQSHPEGGYFKEIYRSDVEVNLKTHTRSTATSIYFLLKSGEVSKFHRLSSDELWYYHAGGSLEIHCISPQGEYYMVTLGGNLQDGEKLQHIIPANTIFGASIKSNNSFSLVGCMVTPGFDFTDFKLFSFNELVALYPQYEKVIKEFT